VLRVLRCRPGRLARQLKEESHWLTSFDATIFRPDRGVHMARAAWRQELDRFTWLAIVSTEGGAHVEPWLRVIFAKIDLKVSPDRTPWRFSTATWMAITTNSLQILSQWMYGVCGNLDLRMSCGPWRWPKADKRRPRDKVGGEDSKVPRLKGATASGPG